MTRIYRPFKFKIIGIFLFLMLVVIYPLVSIAVCQFSQTSQRNQLHENGFNSNRPWQRVILSNKSGIGEYPKDVFSEEELQNGAVVLYIFGILYMFLALSIICDEFFVPALHVISDILAISDDVAGATFMAAGGSAPELFTSILGVFVAKSQIGFGTIVGSAVFNVLFVIGMCVIFSKSVLHLTWWPLLRDSVFYSFSLGLLIAFFSDSNMQYWESLLLFAVYISYVTFMYFNERVEAHVKNFIATVSGNKSKVTPQTDVGTHYRNGALQLVIHTLDPISEASAENKFHQIKAILEVEVETEYKDPKEASILVREKYRFERETRRILDEGNGEINADLRKKAMVNNYLGDGSKDKANSKISTDNVESPKIPRPSNSQYPPSYTYTNYDNTQTPSSRSNSDCSLPNGTLPIQDEDSSITCKPNRGASVNSACSNNFQSASAGWQRVEKMVRFSGRMSKMSCASHHGMSRLCLREAAAERQNSIVFDDEVEEPLSLAWPSSNWERVWYIVKLPIILPLFCTLPDVRKPALRKFFAWTFLGSILWIGGFSYLMIWWASVTGNTLGIPPEVMGLTFLAAGTSIPDLITSVLVAREGLGDMAVSSSIGSNIFDVTVGLPIPWFIWSAVNSWQPKSVKSKGLFCSTFLLFFMLVSVMSSIAFFKWRMTRSLAAAMFMLYALFLTISLLMEFRVFPCFL